MSRTRLALPDKAKDGLKRVRTALILMIILVIIAIPKGSVTGISEEPVNRDITRYGDKILVSAWTIPWEPSCRTGMDKWVDTVDSLSPYWYQTLTDGSINTIFNSSYFEEYLDFCGSNGIELIPLVSNIHDPETVQLIVRDESVQRDHIQDLVDLTLDHGFHGLEINYESLYTEDRDAYVNFIGNLSDELHLFGKVLHVSVFPKTSEADNWYGPAGYDYPGLGEKADFIRLMAYNLHWSTCEVSGPVTSYDWVDKVVSYASSVIDPDKLILGIPQYGYEWPIRGDGSTTGIAENHTYESTSELMEDRGIERSWNITSRSPYFVYEDDQGTLRSHHYTDSESLLHEMDIVLKHGIRGISIWRIGSDDPLSEAYIRQIKADGADNLPPFVRIGEDIKGMVGTEIAVGPSVVYDIDGYAVDVLWDFDDGSYSPQIDPIHVFDRGGIYNVSIMVADNGGSLVRRNKLIRIGPFSSLSGELYTKEGQPVHFDGSGSWDLNEIVSYSWNFGDGTYLFHHTSTAEHTYRYPGIYNVSLTVINSMGFSDSGEMKVVINDNDEPLADGGGDQIVWEDGTVYLDASFSSDNDRDLNYTWTIGDTSAYGIFLKWVFPDPGIYPVYLTVTDPTGNQDVDLINITVRDRTAPVLKLDYSEVVLLGDEIHLNISSSYDNVEIHRIIWHLDEGGPLLDRTGLTLEDYPAGRYYFTVEIFDLEGNWNSTTVHIDVVDSFPPICSMSHDPEPRPLNETYLDRIEGGRDLDIPEDLAGTYVINESIMFSAIDIEDRSGIHSVIWLFGDGGEAAGETVYHHFGSVGIFRIALKITDLWGNIMVRNHSLLILPSLDIIEEEHQPYIDLTVVENITVIEGDNETVEKKDDEGADRWTWLPYATAAGFVILMAIASLDVISLVKRRRKEKSTGEDTEVKPDEI